MLVFLIAGGFEGWHVIKLTMALDLRQLGADMIFRNISHRRVVMSCADDWNQHVAPHVDPRQDEIGGWSP